MKYFSQINKILTKKQKKAMFFLTILIIISMSFEILTLNSLFILLAYMTNPTTISDSQIFIYLKKKENHLIKITKISEKSMKEFLLKNIFLERKFR